MVSIRTYFQELFWYCCVFWREMIKRNPMSIESAKAFLERTKNDEDFRKSVGEIATVEERMENVKSRPSNV